MSTFNDTASVTTLSEMNSICGNSTVDMAQEIVRLQEEIRLMKAGKPSQLIPPCWITKETEAVEQCLDEFRVAFNEAKQFILEKRNNEDIAEDYEELKKASQVTDEVKEVWMSAARDVKKHLGGITNTLNGCCGNISVEKTKTDSQVKEQLWMDLDLSGIPVCYLPVVNSTDVVPIIDADAMKICEGLVGAWKFDDTSRTCPNNASVPSKLVISLHSSGFFLFQRQNNTTETGLACFRPDGQRYSIEGNKEWDRQCTIKDDHILCRCICIDGRTQDYSFRFVSEGRIEYTFIKSVFGPTDGTFAYIAEI